MSDPLDRLRSALADRYRIESQLGQGGMATVYLAHDIRHDRKVALKVLKPELAAVLGSDRFVVEIRTTAALQHPHILPLFDSGSADGFLYYVMPYIQGETLRSKLDRETQLGIEEAVRITSSVADALDYAHRHGVIHRDIKPENILLHDGRPMVADFGIALAVSAAAGGRMTETGMSLGTPHYMSPEQATADKEISARSDVYSLASVLYEMLSGSPPHTGSSAQQIIMKIIAEPVAPVTTLRRSVPPHIAAALAMALEKLPADRFDSARAFAAALANPGFTFGTSASAAGVPAGRDWRQRFALPALVAAGLLGVALVLSLKRPPASPTPVARYRVTLPENRGLSGNSWSRLAVSPDGSRLVYVADLERGTGLMVRGRDQLDAEPVPGTEGAINPAFSPHGDRVAFMDRAGGGSIKVVSLGGGAVTVITDSLVGAPGVAWGPDGFIYYDRIGVGGLMRVPEAGGKAESISVLDSARGELQHSWPDVLPNGRGVLFTASHHGPGSMGGPEEELAVLDLATGTHRVLLKGLFGRYAHSGHLVYVTATGALMAVPFDQDRMRLTGEPVSLGDGVGVRVGGGAVDLTISSTGTLWYAAGAVGSSGSYQGVWVSREGVATPIPGVVALLTDPALSPDGRRLAITVRELVADIFIKELDQGPFSRLTGGGSNSLRAAWTADGRSVAFVTQQVAAGARRELHQRPADGSREATPLAADLTQVEEVTFSRDGVWLLYRTGVSPPGERNLYARRLGADSSIALATTGADETSPALSPDGRWLAYVSNESGGREVFVRPFPNTGDGRWQISTQGGEEPVWAPSGRELFYRTTGASVDTQMVMEVATGAVFVPGARRALFPLGRYVTNDIHQQYAVSPDGQRFVMIRAPEAGRTEHLVVVENFFEVLSRPRR
ncbi:MAG TPA: protein kinase [Gemmatimonadales bacterium]|nr:protein kinase [Gemmatimonadales bacterium]